MDFPHILCNSQAGVEGFTCPPGFICIQAVCWSLEQFVQEYQRNDAGVFYRLWDLKKKQQLPR